MTIQKLKMKLSILKKVKLVKVKLDKILLTGTKRKLSMFFKNIVFCCKNLQVSLIEKPLLKPIKERKTRKKNNHVWPD